VEAQTAREAMGGHTFTIYAEQIPEPAGAAARKDALYLSRILLSNPAAP
jgi:hypothetical protein